MATITAPDQFAPILPAIADEIGKFCTSLTPCEGWDWLAIAEVPLNRIPALHDRCKDLNLVFDRWAYAQPSPGQVVIGICRYELPPFW